MESMIEIVTSFQRRGEFDDLRKLSYILPFHSNLYRSVYIYSDQINQLIAEGKDYTSYQGKYFIDTIVLDIDGHGSPKSMELAKEKVNDTAAWLMSKDVDPDNFLVWFSGGGFHIHIAASLFDFKPGRNLPDSVRDTMLTLFPYGDNIYYPRAIVRVGYSFNEKRKLWKIPLTLAELSLDISQIKQLAKSSEIRSGISYDKDCLEPVLESYRVDAEDKFKKTDIDLPEKTDFINVVTCMHKLYERGPIEGRRHTDMLRLASWMRRGHMPASVVNDSLIRWAANVPEKEIEKIVHDVYTKDYRYGCNDNVRSEYCDSRCIYFEKKNEGTEVMNYDDMDAEMIDFALMGGYEHYMGMSSVVDTEYRMYPGEFIVVTGDTGVNKSTFVQQLALENPSHKILYISTEVDRRLMYRRFLQMVTSMGKDDIMSVFSSGNSLPGSERLKHILIVDNVPTWQRLVDIALDIKPTVIIIDVLEDIGQGDSLENIEHNARASKSLAMQLNNIIIAVNHMRKSSGSFRRNTKTLDDSKGSGSIKQKADKVIMIEGDNTGLERTVRSGKARDEEPFSKILTFNPTTFKLELNGH